MITGLDAGMVGGGVLIALVIIWSLVWKGYALWTASKRNQTWWFIFLLILNTFGILEIIYLFAVAKKRWSDIKEDVRKPL